MKLMDLNSENIKELSSSELNSLHRRCHQLYAINKKNKLENKSLIKMTVRTHSLIVVEMKRRGFKHNTPLEEGYEFLEKYLEILN